MQTIDPYLTKGKLPSQDEINQFLSPYQLNKEAKRDLISALIYRNKIEREVGFLIETSYFKLLKTWNDTYRKLLEQIAKDLDMNQKAVERWLSFIHMMPSYLKTTPTPEENVVKEIISMYEQYLLSDTLPHLGLHAWIARSISSGFSKNKVHKVLATYRQQLRQQFFDKHSPKPTQFQPPSAAEDNPKTEPIQ